MDLFEIFQILSSSLNPFFGMEWNGMEQDGKLQFSDHREQWDTLVTLCTVGNLSDIEHSGTIVT